MHCTPTTPWGIHLSIRNDEECTRCGWTAPGPRTDARADAAEAAEALAASHGWSLIEGGLYGHGDADPLPETRAA